MWLNERLVLDNNLVSALAVERDRDTFRYVVGKLDVYEHCVLPEVRVLSQFESLSEGGLPPHVDPDGQFNDWPHSQDFQAVVVVVGLAKCDGHDVLAVPVVVCGVVLEVVALALGDEGAKRFLLHDVVVGVTLNDPQVVSYSDVDPSPS